jgi:hypothetical protein
MDAIYSSETSLTSTGLRGVISQKIELFNDSYILNTVGRSVKTALNGLNWVCKNWPPPPRKHGGYGRSVVNNIWTSPWADRREGAFPALPSVGTSRACGHHGRGTDEVSSPWRLVWWASPWNWGHLVVDVDPLRADGFVSFNCYIFGTNRARAPLIIRSLHLLIG